MEPFELKERHFCATSFHAKKLLESHGYKVVFEGPKAHHPEQSVWFFIIDEDMVRILQEEYFKRPVIWTWPGRYTFKNTSDTDWVRKKDLDNI